MSKKEENSKEITLGQNIEHLRKMHGETLAELGDAVFIGNTAIKNYESGDRDPKPQMIVAIAKHYGKTVDELLKSDLSELGIIDFTIKGPKAAVELWKIMVPLSSSEKALKNPNFKKGYEKCHSILDSFSENDPVMGYVISDCFESFSKAIEEDELPEAVANIIWLVFLEWSQIMDQNMVETLSSVLYPRKNQPSTSKAYMRAKSNESEEIIEKRKEFIKDMDDFVMEMLKELKSLPEWADLADYFLALKYILRMVDTGLSPEMNEAVGMQMLLSQVQLGNEYSFNTLKTTLSL